MDKFVPYEKLSKKEKRKLDNARRQTWGALSPVTRKPENSKAYNRNKARNWKREMRVSNSGCLFFEGIVPSSGINASPGFTFGVGLAYNETKQKQEVWLCFRTKLW